MAKAKQIKTIKDLTPDRANVNKGSERGAYMVDWSLTELGAGRSILADRSGNVLAGNKTLEAAAAHGFPVQVVESDGKSLIVVQRTDLDLDGNDKERVTARQMAFADNRASEVGYVPDVTVLLEHYQSGVDLSAMYRDDEIDALMASLTPDGMGGEPQDAEPQIDKAAELNEKWKVKTGDLWLIGEHRLLCGDSTKAEDVARVVDGQKAALCLTDPPYGIAITRIANRFGDSPHLSRKATNENWDDAIPDKSAFDLIFKHSANQIVFGANYFWEYFRSSQCYVIWDKRGDLPDVPFAPTEFAWTSFDRMSKKYTVINHGFIRDEPKQTDHPTEKPLGLFIKILEDFTKPDDLVFEPFAGSGTTLAAAENLKRKCFALEANPLGCAVILERMATAFPSLKIKRAA